MEYLVLLCLMQSSSLYSLFIYLIISLFTFYSFELSTYHCVASFFIRFICFIFFILLHCFADEGYRIHLWPNQNMTFINTLSLQEKCKSIGIPKLPLYTPWIDSYLALYNLNTSRINIIAAIYNLLFSSYSVVMTSLKFCFCFNGFTL